MNLSILREIPGAVHSVVTLRRATKGTKITAGLGVALTGVIGLAAYKGVIMPGDAVDLFQIVVEGVTSATAAFELLAKARAEKAAAKVEARAVKIVKTLNTALPADQQLKEEGDLGPVTQEVADAVASAAAGAPELHKVTEQARAAVRKDIPRPNPSSPPVRKPRNTINGGRGGR